MSGLKEITAGTSQPIRTNIVTSADNKEPAKVSKTATALMQSELEKIMNHESDIQKALNPHPQNEHERFMNRASEIQKMLSPNPQR